MSGYCAASDVGVMVLNILGGQPIFSTSTCPTLQSVNSFITTGCAVIDTYLAAGGYNTPVASTAVAYGMLTRCNTLYAAARVEETRTNITMGPGERNRGTIYEEQFWKCLESLLEMDLTLAGLSRTTTAQIYAGAITVADKSTIESDSTLVKPRFQRDQFAFPGTISPAGTTAS